MDSPPLRPPCPPGAFPYANATLCACAPGRYLSSSGSCALPPSGDFAVHASPGKDPSFLMTVFDFESIRRFTQSQAVFLEATAVALLAWLLFCGAVRLGNVREGRSVWFRIRWWISRLDVFYGRRHWVDDHKVVMKRKTELGGTFSVASWIVFIGLLSALLYQIITKRTIEVHRVKPANSPDLLAFVNDMEFNITTISSMTCSHLRGLDNVVTGTPGFIDFRVFPLSSFADSFCHNTSNGPTITVKCNNCQVPRGNFFISWQFVDLPSHPASAVAFQFNLTTKDHRNDKYVSSVSGTVKSGSYANDLPTTFRGPDANILKIHLFPQIYHSLHNLSIMQPLLHDFLPGSSFSETSKLQASLQNPNDGLINTTLYVRFLADYIVEIENENILGPVSFLANVGGLYAFCVAVFLCFMLQFEYRFKKLRNEDTVFHDILAHKRAQRNWDKLRKFVMYTWNYNVLDGKKVNNSKRHGSSFVDSFCGRSNKTRQQIRTDSISTTNPAKTPAAINRIECSASSTNLEEKSSHVEQANTTNG